MFYGGGGVVPVHHDAGLWVQHTDCVHVAAIARWVEGRSVFRGGVLIMMYAGYSRGPPIRRWCARAIGPPC